MRVGAGTSGFVLASTVLIYQVTSIPTGLNLIAIFLFFPETQYLRDNPVDTLGVGEAANKIETSTEVAELPIRAKKTFLQELKPWSPINRLVNPLQLFLSPLPLIIYPACIFGFLAYSAALAWLLCSVNTSASVFQAPPYNFSPGINGLINIPATIGSVAGAFCGGALTDKIAEWMARRNNGIYEPEARLVSIVIPFFVIPCGLLM
jgi:hypothetical protein